RDRVAAGDLGGHFEGAAAPCADVAAETVMTTCDTDILSSYLDDELGDAERARVEFHLTGCAECREVLADLASIKETAPALTAIEREPAADLWPGVLTRIRPARTRAVSLSWMQAI